MVSYLRHIVTFILIGLEFNFIEAQCNGPRTEDEYLMKKFGADSSYSKRSSPNTALLLALNNTASSSSTSPANAEPVIIDLTLKVIAVKGMNLRRNEFESTLELTQTWNDQRLAFPENSCLSMTKPFALSESEASMLWQPDVNLRNKVDGIETLEKTVFIHGNGTVQSKHSFISKTSCNLDLAQFPYDTQTCKLLYGSRDADVGEVLLIHNKIVIYTMEDLFPTSEEFTIRGGDASTDDKQVMFSVTVKRESQYYFQFVIIPVLLMVIISWSSLFINRGAAPARVTLSIICFLTISNFISSQFTVLPKLPSRVWLLNFMEISLAYAFIPIVEYVACNYLFRVETRLNAIRKAALEKKIRDAEQYQIDSENNGIGASLPRKSTKNPKNVEVTKKDMVAMGVCRIDKIVLKQNGNMRFKDQHLDIFFRWAYPITYCIVLGTLIGIIRLQS